MKVDAIVKEVLQETPKVRLVRLTWPGVGKFAFRPGQWVGVYCDDFIGENNKPLRRAFSIASSPGENHVELCIARGHGLSAHLQDLKEGAKVHIDGPYGMFWLRPADKYLFIAGGTGIAPFRPMIRQALSEGKEVLLIYSMKTPSDFIYRKELEGLQGKFKMIPTITVEGFPLWEGERGRVQTFLQKYFKNGYQAYLCGPPMMVEQVERKLIALGQPKEHIFLDKWE
ncbi:MAG: FAD-dependent oxidoreductase [Candidatus Woesearchaeota archaeon]